MAFVGLPDELSLRIFSCLSARALVEASLVSRTWNHLCADESLWRGVAVHRWGGSVESLGIEKWRAYCKERQEFEVLRETAVERDKPGTEFIFAPPVGVAFSSTSVVPDAFALGSRLFEEGFVNDAILALETEVRRHPMSANAWALMGKAYAENDQDAEAIACYKIAIAIDPNNREVLMNLGVSLVNELDGREASLYLARWMRLSPYSDLLSQELMQKLQIQVHRPRESRSLSYNLDDIQFDENLWKQSDDFYNELDDPKQKLINLFLAAMQANPQDPDVLIILGVLHSAVNDFQGAIKYFEAALALNQNDYALWNKLGATRANNNMADTAVLAYDRALKLRPNYVRCLINVGISHMARQHYRSSLHFWARALQLNPKATHVWSYMELSHNQADMDFELVKDVQNLPKYLLESDARVKFVPDPDVIEDPYKSYIQRDAQLFFGQKKREHELAHEKKHEEDLAESAPHPDEQSVKKRYSMQELLAMVAEGKTPEDVRDIDDKPPNPDAPVIQGDKKRPLKPWERAGGTKPVETAPASSQPAQVTTSTQSAAAAAAAAAPSSVPKKATPSGLAIYTVDSFTTEAFAGNPAAVCLVPPSVELSEVTMKRIAREMNLSETAFVQPSAGEPNTFRLRWFTPTTEVHLCGHATLATAHVLFTEVGATARSLTFSTLSGNLVVERSEDGSKSPLLRMDFPQGTPEIIRLPDDMQAALLRALGLTEVDLVWQEGPLASTEVERVPMMAICPVTKKIFVEIVSADKLLKLKPDADALLAIPFAEAGLPVRGVSVMVQGGAEDRGRREHLNLAFYTDMSFLPDFVSYDFISRYFSPWNGIYEDPVNGSSHAALVVYWSRQLNKQRMSAYMASARTGELEVALAPEGRMYIYGRAVTVMGGRLRV